MRRIRTTFIPLLIAFAASAHGQSPTEARRQYDAYLNALRTAVLSGNADSLGALVTDDRVAVTGGTGKTLRGRAAQVESDRAFFRASRVTAFEMRVTDFRSSGSLAYATGVGKHTVTDLATGQQRVDQFQYVDILVLENDNRWRSQYFMNAPREVERRDSSSR